MDEQTRRSSTWAARCGSARTRPSSRPGSIVREAYGEEVVYERHRHRYEVNNRYRQPLEEARPGLLGHARPTAGSSSSSSSRRIDAPVLRRDPGPPGVQEPAGPAAPVVRGVRRGGTRRAEGRAPRLPIDAEPVPASRWPVPVSGARAASRSSAPTRRRRRRVPRDRRARDRGPDGETFTRVVVRHPGAVVVVPWMPTATRSLLVRQFRAAIGSELLEVPAGKRDVDGEAPEGTARARARGGDRVPAGPAGEAGRVLQHARVLRRVHVPVRRARPRGRWRAAADQPRGGGDDDRADRARRRRRSHRARASSSTPRPSSGSCWPAATWPGSTRDCA